MRGHLQQRGRDSWRLKVFVGRSSDGKRRYVERTVRGSRTPNGRWLGSSWKLTKGGTQQRRR